MEPVDQLKMKLKGLVFPEQLDAVAERILGLPKRGPEVFLMATEIATEHNLSPTEIVSWKRTLDREGTLS